MARPSSLDSTSRAIHSSVPSHGMAGWSHVSQASMRPSRLTRGAATKSRPVASTATASGRPAAEPSAGIATISFTTSAAAGSPAPWPPAAPTGWRSRTQTIQAPSGVNAPSA